MSQLSQLFQRYGTSNHFVYSPALHFCKASHFCTSLRFVVWPIRQWKFAIFPTFGTDIIATPPCAAVLFVALLAACSQEKP